MMYVIAMLRGLVSAAVLATLEASNVVVAPVPPLVRPGYDCQETDIALMMVRLILSTPDESC